MRQRILPYALTAFSLLRYLAPGISSAAEAAAEATKVTPSNTVAAAAKPAAGADANHPTKAGIEFFEKKIRPVLVSKCYQCHSAAADSVKGELKLDSRDAIRKGGESGAVLVPGDSQSSLLMEALRFEGIEMPPTGKLSDEVIADFATWIDMGAPDPRTGAGVTKKPSLAEARNFWAFKIPNKPPVPAVKNAAWPHTDIDRFVLAGLEGHDLKPVADADKLTWLRRVTFDLTGLPPTLADIDSFLADKTADAEAKVVDRLLASPQYGERWGRHWLDIARYGESTGKERNIPFSHAWKYRDWVIDSVNADKPYTKFAMEQIAGDLLPAANPAAKNEQMLGTGFLALGPKSINERNREQYLMDMVDEQIDVVTRAFLATTVGCARCHDHKFDPISQADYYALAGIFRSTDTLSGVQSRASGGNPRDYGGQLMALADTPSTNPVAAKPAASAPAAKAAPKDPLASLNDEQRKEYNKVKNRLENRKEQLAKLIATAKKGNNKQTAKREGKQLQQQIANDEKKLAEFGTTDGGGSSAGATGDDNVAMGVRDVAKPADTEIRVRGEPDDKGDIVPRGFVAVLKNSTTPKVNASQSGRLELAQWIASRDNPLTARVAVNRIWSHLFGAGIVDSIDNFGALGDEPSNPQLLDYLAVRFVDGGWSTKKLIREIVLSRTYRMASDHDADNYAKDPANINLWRMNRRRLDAEAIRDAMLAAAGTLDLKRPHGSPIASLKPSDEIGRRVSTSGMENDRAKNRSIYLPLVRNAVPESLAVFDVADPSLVVGKREVTTVATQALYLMNSGFAEEHAGQTAERLLSTGPSDDALRIEWAYRTILGRGASADERTRGVRFVKEFAAAAEADPEIAATRREFKAWAALCQSLFASAEFRYLY
jgi:cytochrome c553